MKKLRIIICALFVLCGGLFFAGCKDEETFINFDVNKIAVGETHEFTYNGRSQAVSVSYDDMAIDVDVTYALKNDKNNFKTLEDLETENTGTYEVYYKLSAEGYNSYVSEGTLEFTVVPRNTEIYLQDYIWIKSENQTEIDVQYYANNVVENDDLQLTFDFGEFDTTSAQYGDEHEITCLGGNNNYTYSFDFATLYVRDYVEVYDNQENLKNCYTNLDDAFNNVQDGETIAINDNFEVDKTINIDKSITIDGKSKFILKGTKDIEFAKYLNKDVASMFNLITDEASLTLKDITVDGNLVVRGVSAFAGKVKIDGARIVNGFKNDKWRSGGVYITGKANFEMNSGFISGNDANDNEYTKYCSDLWIGANAIGSLASINGGTVGNVFVNSNSYSSTGAGKFVLDGGAIDNIYVEYDAGYGANFEYIKGDIEHLKVALSNDHGGYCGVYYELIPQENTTYVGGKLVYGNLPNTFKGETLNENLTDLEEGKTYIFENCTFNVPITISSLSNFVFNNCIFSTTSSDGATNLYVSSLTGLVVNNCVFNGNTTGGFAIDVNLCSSVCEQLVISNNVFNTISDEQSAISIKSRLGLTDRPVGDWALNQTEGIINCQVQILGNDFIDFNNKIIIGIEPQGADTSANVSTGDFEVLVDGNLDIITIYNKHQDSAHAEEGAKVVVEQKGVYNSANY